MHIDSADLDGALGAVEQPQDQVHQRRLARARTADDGSGLTGCGREGDVTQHGMFGARVVEADAFELERAVLEYLAHGIDGGNHARIRVEHFLNAIGRHRRARDHRDHEGGHHHRHEDLDEVGEVRDEGSDLDPARVHTAGAQPQHGDEREVDQKVHGREHR